MAFIDKSKANYSFKTIQGKAHTSNKRGVHNEAIPSGFILTGDRIFAESIQKVPSNGSNDGIVSDLVELTLKPIIGTDDIVVGKWSGYRAYIDGIVPATLSGIINPITNLPYANGDTVGNIIPNSYGVDFEPILKNDGTRITPLDASDWFIDPYSGVVVQEADSPVDMFKLSSTLTTNHKGTLECYIYIGNFIVDRIEKNEILVSKPKTEWLNSVEKEISTIPTNPNDGDRYIVEIGSGGDSINRYNYDTKVFNTYTTIGNDIIEYYTNDNNATGWKVTNPSPAMTVSIRSDKKAIYQFYDGIYKRQSFIQVPTSENKNMDANDTNVDGDKATDIKMLNTPSDGSYIEVLLNGIQIKVENVAIIGNDVTSPCYFSNEGGTTHTNRNIRKLSEVQENDELFWVGSNIGYELDSDDKIDFNYNITL